MNENKVSCGGFRIGDGLAMDGNTLKSLGGAYVKVKVNINDDRPTLEFMDDSPLKTFEEIVQKTETSLVTLLVYVSDEVVRSFFLDKRISGDLIFYAFSIGENILRLEELSINSDNKITFSIFAYTLTPAT